MPDVYKRYLAETGWEWVPTMEFGVGCQVHLRADELPEGRLIVRLSKHLAAVIDGVLHDTHDCSRDGTRCVYGYWTQLEPNGPVLKAPDLATLQRKCEDAAGLFVELYPEDED